MRPSGSSTELTTTNPLVLYRALLATNRITPDPAQHGEFAAFLEVLKVRCETWEMEGSKDYRRIDIQGDERTQADSTGNQVSKRIHHAPRCPIRGALQAINHRRGRPDDIFSQRYNHAPAPLLLVLVLALALLAATT